MTVMKKCNACKEEHTINEIYRDNLMVVKDSSARK